MAILAYPYSPTTGLAATGNPERTPGGLSAQQGKLHREHCRGFWDSSGPFLGRFRDCERREDPIQLPFTAERLLSNPQSRQRNIPTLRAMLSQP